MAAAMMVAPVYAASRDANDSFVPQRGGPARGSQSYLGVDLKDISDDQVVALKLKDARGAEITRVDHDGPAGKMGLREHDVVIQMNGVLIEGQEHIRRMLSATPPGQSITLVISRDGRQMTMSAQIADRSEVERQAWEQHLGAPPPQAPTSALPSDEASAAGTIAQPGGAAPASRYSRSFLGSILMTPTYTGVLLERLGPQLATFFGVPSGSGLLVRNVENNSPAAMAGLRAGDIVLRANSQSVGTMNDWARAIKDAKGRPVSVVVQRDRAQMTMVLTPDTKKRSGLEMPEVEMPYAPSNDIHVARLTIY
jgi:S1-C subfamily serine protease